jgi:hypothetical protein
MSEIDSICLEIKYKGKILGTVKAQYDFSDLPLEFHDMAMGYLSQRLVVVLSRGVMDPEYNKYLHDFNCSWDVWFKLSQWQRFVEAIKNFLGKPSLVPPKYNPPGE